LVSVDQVSFYKTFFLHHWQSCQIS